jgi:hypothetical protein
MLRSSITLLAPFHPRLAPSIIRYSARPRTNVCRGTGNTPLAQRLHENVRNEGQPTGLLCQYPPLAQQLPPP